MKQIVIFFVVFTFNLNAQTTYKDASDQKEHYAYMPKSHYNTLKIRINYVFVQDEYGNKNFDIDSAETDELFREMTWRINKLYAGLKDNSDTICYPFDDHIVDSKIRFRYQLHEVKTKKEWNYLEWGFNDGRNIGKVSPSSKWPLAGIDDSLMSQENYPVGINIYYTNNGDLLADLQASDTIRRPKIFQKAVSRFPSYTDLNRSSQIHMMNKFALYWHQKYHGQAAFNRDWHSNRGTKWWWLNGFTGIGHEIGHSLSLAHSNEWHRANKCSYSIMSQRGGDKRNWLAPTEVAKVHFALTHSSAHQFVEETSTYGCDLIIEDDVVWSKFRRVYYDNIIIKRGASLTIEDGPIIFPEDCKIVIKRGGELVLNKEVSLKDVFGETFKKIKKSWWGKLKVK